VVAKDGRLQCVYRNFSSFPKRCVTAGDPIPPSSASTARRALGQTSYTAETRAH